MIQLAGLRPQSISRGRPGVETFFLKKKTTRSKEEETDQEYPSLCRILVHEDRGKAIDRPKIPSFPRGHRIHRRRRGFPADKLK